MKRDRIVSTRPPYRIRTFGGLEVVGEGLRVSLFGSRRARTLLSFLAASDHPVSRDSIAKLLWPDDLLSSAKPRLRTELHRLREALGVGECILAVEGDSVSIDRERAEIDTILFRSCLEEASRAGNEGACLSSLEEGLDLLQGPWLPHEAEGWCLTKRAAWDDLALKAFEQAVRATTTLGRHGEALVLARRGLSLLSDRPSLIRLVMESLAAVGDVPEAIAVYDRYADRLWIETDLVPDERIAAYAADLRRRNDRTPQEGEWSRADLPTRTVEVFGREELVASIAEALRSTSVDAGCVLNLMGPGGAGKTTLALEVARRLEPEFRGRVYYVSLARVTDAEGLGSAVAGAISAASGDAISIAQRIKCGPVLLVLDNFEQLVPSGSLWLNELARRVPETRILVTSRRALQLSIERRVAVPPLTMPCAIALYVDRASRVVPGYAPGPNEISEIGRLADRLEGLPLALVLAAARASSFGPGEVLRDLDSLDVPSAPQRDLEERHRSLALAMDWSLALLDPEARAFLGKLTAFPKDWSMEAAKSIVGHEAVRLLPALVDQSLVSVSRTEAGPRFRLPQVIREDLLKRSGGPSQETQNRHASFFAERVELAHKIQKTDLNACMALLKPEASNLEAALFWLRDRTPERYRKMLAEIATYWAITLEEGRAVDWLLAAAVQTEEDGSALASDLNRAAARLLLVAGRYDEAEVRINATERLNRVHGDQAAVLWALRARSHLAYYRSDYARMTTVAEATLRLAEEMGDELSQALSLSDMAMALTNLGRGEAALRCVERSLTIHRARNDESRVLAARENYATTLMSLRCWRDAELVLEELLQRCREVGHEAVEVQCLTHLATVCIHSGRLSEAEEYLALALESSRPTDGSLLLGVRHRLAVLIGIKRKNRRATERSTQALFAAWSSVSNGPAILAAVDVLALALATFDHPEAGKRLLDGSDALREKHGLSVSPHYSVTYEEARSLLGPRGAIDPPDTFEALYRGARDAIWSL